MDRRVGLARQIIGLFLLVASAGYGLPLISEPGLWLPPLAVAAPAEGAVILDPGHGGVDGGTSGGGVLEKEITLKMALLIRTHLEADGLPVRMTREADIDLGGPRKIKGRHRRDLQSRAQIGAEGAVMVSLHMNASQSGVERGLLVIYKRGSAESERLARLIDGRVRQLPDVVIRQKPAAWSSLYIMKANPNPTVLVEMGFLTNARDRELFQRPEFRDQLARQIAAAIADYFRGDEPGDEQSPSA